MTPRFIDTDPPDRLAEKMLLSAYFALQRVAEAVLADLNSRR